MRSLKEMLNEDARKIKIQIFAPRNFDKENSFYINDYCIAGSGTNDRLIYTFYADIKDLKEALKNINKKDNITIQVIATPNDKQAIYLNDYRIVGPKPLGGGSVLYRFFTKLDDLEIALKIKY